MGTSASSIFLCLPAGLAPPDPPLPPLVGRTRFPGAALKSTMRDICIPLFGNLRRGAARVLGEGLALPLPEVRRTSASTYWIATNV
eukprot:13416857-Alexandrium_andersonii.AAC.1